MDTKILEIEDKDGLITAAKYLCSFGGVDTEGWWIFGDPVLKKPFAEVTESDVTQWVLAEAGQLIENNLKAQKEVLDKPKSVPPWLPQTFTPNLGA